MELVNKYPIPHSTIRKSVELSWNKILSTKIGGELQIGTDYKPTPQMLGNFLHLMIPIELEKLTSLGVRQGIGNIEKDIVYTEDRSFDLEIKTSSSRSIFANRSYAQPSSPEAKDKSGYYLAINFQSFNKTENPIITTIKLGWLNHEDWIPQRSSTGQQARLAPKVWENKFIKI